MPLIYYFGFSALLIAVIVGTYFLSKIKDGFLFLYLFTCAALLSEVSMNLIDSQNNIFVSHIYFPVEFLLIALFYYRHFSNSKHKKWLKFVVLLFMIYCVLTPIFIQSVNDYSKVRSFSSIILILFSIMHLHKIMMEGKVSRLVAEPMVWINAAVLFYFSTSLFYSALFMLILEYSREFSKLTHRLFIMSNIVFYLLIAIGFYKAGRPKPVANK